MPVPLDILIVSIGNKYTSLYVLKGAKILTPINSSPFIFKIGSAFLGIFVFS